MGSGTSAARAKLVEPLRIQVSPATAQDEAAPDASEFTLRQLNIETPPFPGDVSLCGRLSRDVARALAPRFKSWVNVNGPEDPDFCPEELQRAGVERVEVRPFPGPPTMPSEEQVQAALEALDTLPRPLMLQCTSGTRVGVLLVLWLAKKHGYSAESAQQLASDADFSFWRRCHTCGPIRDWLLARMPAADAGTVMKPAEGLIFSQLFDPETWTYTYLLACDQTKEALLIDPVLEQKNRDLTLINELGLELRYVLNTHCHADHITSGGSIRKDMPWVRTVIAKASGAKADILVDPNDKVTFGRFSVEVLPTPGHTDGCVSYLLRGSPSMVFTGDALLIRGCGRTDFQQGDSGKLYDSVHAKIFSLPPDTLVYPGHDYKERNVSTVDEEKRFNPRLTKSRDEFIQLMADLKLPYPAKIDEAVPWNLVCGVQD